ncbi:MAG: glycosyltransferase family 2 protein [Deltaproteobacteria bacterium]
MENNIHALEPGKVSVVISAFNRKLDLKRCLESVLKQDYKNYEVIVVDNNSSDGTRDMVLSEYPGVFLLCNKINAGVCKAKNRGAVESNGEYLWFLDSDTVVAHNDCLSKMVKIINSNKAIGSVGGIVYVRDDCSEKMILPNDGIFNMVDDWDKQSYDEVACDYTFANLFIKKELFLELGGFTEEYFFYMEDNDFGLKIRRRGLRNITSRRTIVRHAYRQPPQDFKKSYLFCRATFFYIFKNYKIKEWFGVMADMLKKNRFLKRDKDNVEKRTVKTKIFVYLGLLAGFLGSIILVMAYHIQNILFGKQRYLSKYIRQP